MSWQAVTKKDFQDSVRSWWFLGLTAAFVVFFAASVYFLANPLSPSSQQGAKITSDNFIQVMLITTRLFVPIIAIVLAYSAITGERDSGTLKLLLSLPHSRADVVGGKLLGRGGVVVIPVIVGLLAGAAAFLLTSITLKPLSYLQFAALTALLGLVWVAIAVGISAGASSNRRSMIGSVGLYTMFSLFWARFAANIGILLRDYLGITRDERILLEVVLKMFNPIAAYRSLSYRVTIAGPLEARAIVIPQNQQRIFDFQYLLREIFRTEVPWYLTDAAVLAYLLAWLVIPPVLGYLVFRDVDL